MADNIYRYYLTDLGYHTIIVDDTLYAYAQSIVGHSFTGWDGSLTAGGIEFMNLIGANKIYCTMLMGAGVANFSTTYTGLHALLPNLTDYYLPVSSSSTTTNLPVNNNQSKIINLTYSCTSNNAYQLQRTILISNTDTQSTLYGIGTRYSTNNEIRFVSQQICVFNTTMSAATRITISAIAASSPNLSISATAITNPLLSTLKDFYTGFDPVIIGGDPYAGAGDSDTGGGGGTFDGSSDPVAVPSLPSVGATNTGFISLFVPTQAQLKQVADYLWSGLFDLSTYLKIFENPMECILGLSIVPVTVPTSGSAQITVGNIELSGISLPLASQQYVEVDCGTISFTDKYFGSYLDQDPYTKMALFVPYSGIHSVKADDIMGKTVGLKYHIDILTGSLVAFLTCGNSVLYEFNGACASNIPVNSINYASTIENAIRIAVNIGTTVATAGAAAPMTGAETATREAARTFGTAVNMAGSTAEGILSLKPNIDRAGSLGGTTGLMGNQTPYFIITRPRLCKPANQNTFKGYPSFIQVAVSDLVGQGYTEFDTIILAGLYLTDAEKEELQQILKSGVYL